MQFSTAATPLTSTHSRGRQTRGASGTCSQLHGGRSYCLQRRRNNELPDHVVKEKQPNIWREYLDEHPQRGAQRRSNWPGGAPTGASRCPDWPSSRQAPGLRSQTPCAGRSPLRDGCAKSRRSNTQISYGVCFSMRWDFRPRLPIQVLTPPPDTAFGIFLFQTGERL